MSAADSWLPYLNTFGPPDARLLGYGYAVGSLLSGVADNLHLAITSAEPVRISNDIPAGVEAPLLKPYKLAKMNEQHLFRAFDAASVAALHSTLQALRAPVTQLLKTPWRVLTCRSWTTRAGGEDSGMNAWHSDGGLEAIPKIMVYSSPTGEGYGGIELRPPESGQISISISGPPGLWVLFYSSKLEHRGVAPSLPHAVRVATEITIAPARAFDLEPRSLGPNARYPARP